MTPASNFTQRESVALAVSLILLAACFIIPPEILNYLEYPVLIAVALLLGFYIAGDPERAAK